MNSYEIFAAGFFSGIALFGIINYFLDRLFGDEFDQAREIRKELFRSQEDIRNEIIRNRELETKITQLENDINEEIKNKAKIVEYFAGKM